MKKNNDLRYILAKKVTIIGAIVNIFLSLAKIIGGFVFNSHGLVADGVHSLIDFFTDLMVLVASKFSNKSADDGHPYGHQKIETAATLLLSVFFVLSGVGIILDSFYALSNPHHAIPSYPAIIIAVISILSNEALFWYTYTIGKHIKSKLIEANAWHHRADVWSSFLVLLGLIGSLLHYPKLDSIAAIVVSFVIIKIGIEYFWVSVQELIDSSVSPEDLSDIRKTILNIPGIEKIHQLRTRKIGHNIFLDVHILVSNNISVSEGHYIAQKVHYTLIAKNNNILDVTVHVDPEDDEINKPCRDLPDRSKIEKNLLVPWQKLDNNLYKWYIHYLDGSIDLEIFFKKEPNSLVLKRIAEDKKYSHNIKDITIYCDFLCLS